MRAEGVRAEQLPALPGADVDGAAVHADAPESASAATGDGLVAERRTVQTIIPERPGTLELPALEVAWFDTATGVARTAVLPAETLRVAPSRGSVSDPVELADAGTSAGSSADGGPATVKATGDGRRWRLAVAAAVIGGLAAVAALVAAASGDARRAGAVGGARPTSRASALAGAARGRTAGRPGGTRPGDARSRGTPLAARSAARAPGAGRPSRVARSRRRARRARRPAVRARRARRGDPRARDDDAGGARRRAGRGARRRPRAGATTRVGRTGGAGTGRRACRRPDVRSVRSAHLGRWAVDYWSLLRRRASLPDPDPRRAGVLDDEARRCDSGLRRGRHPDALRDRAAGGWHLVANRSSRLRPCPVP